VATARARPARTPALRPSARRVCTHAGCLVQFDQRADVLVCPCHGAEFDPTRGASVIAGPAPSPLRSIPVAIDQARGTVVATA
jgi:thiosulfate dehydrogenase (quinone) large subunit